MEKRTPIHLLIVGSFLAITYLMLYYEVSIARSLGISLKSFGVLISIIEISISLAICKIIMKRDINYFTSKGWTHGAVTFLLFPLMFLVSTPVSVFHEKIFKEKFSTQQSIADVTLESKEEVPKTTEQKAASTSKDIGLLILAALSEELTYRVLLIGLLTAMFSGFNAVMLSSLLFGISHLWAQLGYQPSLFVSSFVVLNSTAVAMVLGFIYLRSGLVASFIFHLLTNLAVQYIRPNPVYWKTFCIALIVMTIILGIFLIAKIPNALKSVTYRRYKKKTEAG